MNGPYYPAPLSRCSGQLSPISLIRYPLQKFAVAPAGGLLVAPVHAPCGPRMHGRINVSRHAGLSIIIRRWYIDNSPMKYGTTCRLNRRVSTRNNSARSTPLTRARAKILQSLLAIPVIVETPSTVSLTDFSTSLPDDGNASANLSALTGRTIVQTGIKSKTIRRKPVRDKRLAWPSQSDVFLPPFIVRRL
jgi:hypothetical protein